MAPLTGVLIGMVIVAFDFRIDDVDLIADPVGWVMIALFAGRLARADPWFSWARACAWTGAVFAVPDMFGLHTEGVVVIATAILQAAVLFCLCTGMIRRIEPGHPAAPWLNVLRWVDVVGTALMVVALPTASGTEAGVVVAGILFIGIIGTAIGFLVLALTLRAHPALQAASA